MLFWMIYWHGIRRTLVVEMISTVGLLLLLEKRKILSAAPTMRFTAFSTHYGPENGTER
jgi:hypothetical protein